MAALYVLETKSGAQMFKARIDLGRKLMIETRSFLTCFGASLLSHGVLEGIPRLGSRVL